MPDDRDDNTHRIRAALTALVRERVHPRFALTIDAFVRHLHTGPLSAATDPLQYAGSLHLDDLYLATACIQQDDAAWTECGREHFPFMRDFAGRFLPRDAAREVTDMVIADLWQRGKLARYEGRSALRTWLGAVTAHAALNAAKTRDRSNAPPDGHGPRPVARTTAGRPEQKEAAAVLSALVQEAVAALSDDDRLLLLFHYEQDLSLDRIAALLDSSKATLSRRLKRIREQMRQTVEGLTRTRYQSSTDDVRRAIDLSDVEFDLSLLLKSRPVKGSGGDAV